MTLWADVSNKAYLYCSSNLRLTLNFNSPVQVLCQLLAEIEAESCSRRQAFLLLKKFKQLFLLVFIHSKPCVFNGGNQLDLFLPSMVVNFVDLKGHFDEPLSLVKLTSILEYITHNLLVQLDIHLSSSALEPLHLFLVSVNILI